MPCDCLVGSSFVMAVSGPLVAHLQVAVPSTPPLWMPMNPWTRWSSEQAGSSTWCASTPPKDLLVSSGGPALCHHTLLCPSRVHYTSLALNHPIATEWCWTSSRHEWPFVIRRLYQWHCAMTTVTIKKGGWSWFNIKIPYYSKSGDEMIIRSSYLHNRISYTGKMAFLYCISLLCQVILLIAYYCISRG